MKTGLTVAEFDPALLPVAFREHVRDMASGGRCRWTCPPCARVRCWRATEGHFSVGSV